MSDSTSPAKNAKSKEVSMLMRIISLEMEHINSLRRKVESSYCNGLLQNLSNAQTVSPESNGEEDNDASSVVNDGQRINNETSEPDYDEQSLLNNSGTEYDSARSDPATPNNNRSNNILDLNYITGFGDLGPNSHQSGGVVTIPFDSDSDSVNGEEDVYDENSSDEENTTPVPQITFYIPDNQPASVYGRFIHLIASTFADKEGKMSCRDAIRYVNDLFTPENK